MWHLVTLVAISLLCYVVLVLGAVVALRTPPTAPQARCFATYCPHPPTAVATPQP